MVAKLLLFLNCAIIACVHAYGDEYGYEGGEMDGMNPFSGSDPYGDGYGMGGYDGYGEDEEEPLYTLLDSVESIESFVAENMDYLVVIGIFDSDSNPNMEAYLNLVSEVRGPKYGRVSSRQILDDMNFETSSTVVLSYKPSRYFNSKYEQRRSRFPGKELTSVSLQRFVINSFPLVIPRIAEIDSLYESAKLPILYVYTTIDTQGGILSKHLTYLSNRLRQISLEYKGHLLISIADLSQYQYQFSSFGLTYDGSKKSQDVFLVITTVDTHYPMMTLSNHEFNSDNARDFIKNFMSGNLFGKRRIDLGDDVDVEFAPEVIEISDVDLARNILYPVEKFTFVEFYAPWCGHCKQFKSTMNDLAVEFKHDSNIQFAAIDATSTFAEKYLTTDNRFEISGYPSCYLISNQDGSAVLYKGDKSQGAISRFISSKTHHGAADDIAFDL